MLDALRLYSFFKVYPFSFLATIATFAAGYFATKNVSGTTDVILMAFIGFIFLSIAGVLNSIQNGIIFSSFLEQQYDEEPLSIGEVISNSIPKAVSYVMVVLTYLLVSRLLVPILMGFVGGLFQVNVLSVEINLLEVIVNFFLTTWIIFALAEITVLDINFFETVNETFKFLFNRFSSCFFVFVCTLAAAFITTFTVVATASLSYIVATLVRALVLSYVVAALQSYVITLFTTSYAEDEEDVDEEEYEED